jgi:hypothetical protein
MFDIPCRFAISLYRKSRMKKLGERRTRPRSSSLETDFGDFIGFHFKGVWGQLMLPAT